MLVGGVNMRSIAVFLLALTIAIPQLGVAAPNYRGMTLGPEVTSTDIDDLAACFASGLPNIVRHQLFNHSSETDNLTEYSEWLDDALEALEDLMPYYQSYGVKVIVDMHTPYKGFVDPLANPAIHELFTDATLQSNFISLWQTIATRMASHSANIYGYLMLNEPAEPNSVSPGIRDWNTLASDTATAIRAIDSVTPIIMLARYGNPTYISKIVIPAVSNMIIGTHFYPFLEFNQQCIGDNDCGLKYPTRCKKNKKSRKCIGGRNPREMLFRFKKARSFMAKNPTVKFGVFETAQSRFTDYTSYQKYIKDLFDMFEESGVNAYLFHSFREANEWSIEHDNDPNNNSPIGCDNNRANQVESYFSNNP